ncbi:type I restriction-modification system methyltransferase subunit [Streptococcus pneumoniae]|nr:type I restriction-modification system methyltransferase subunit [Streptococcus pneumoniae]
MITGELKNKIDQLWEILWTEGNANPLTNIEQLTYLLFMKDLDSVELGRESDAEFLGIPYEGVFPKDKPEYRWSTFKNIGDAQEVYRLMTQEIFPFIKNLKGDTDDTAFSRYMREAIFQINKPATLQKAISILDVFPTRGLDVDFDNDKQSITDIIERFHHLEKEAERQRTDQSFFVPVAEIKENDYDLSINKYKEIEYEKVEYEPTEVILKKINDLEKEIQAGLAELEKLLK